MRNSLKSAGRWTMVLGCLLILAVGFTACDDDETYADQKKRERKAVQSLLRRDPLVLVNGAGDTLLNTPKIKVISEEQFERQDSTTDVSQNEYVFFASTGIYMQIVRPGTGRRLEPGDRATLAARYWEFNIMTDSLLTSNRIPLYSPAPDYMDVSNTLGTTRWWSTTAAPSTAASTPKSTRAGAPCTAPMAARACPRAGCCRCIT